VKIFQAVAVLLLASPVPGSAQTPAPAAATSTVPAPANAAAAVDPQLHASVLQLFDVMDLRAKILEGQKAAMPDAKRKLIEASKGAINEQFADEWEKRMLSDARIDAYVVVVASVYEKHFTNAEIEELTQIQRDSNDKKTPTVSESLKAKLGKDGIAVQSEIMGGCTEVGARQGGEIAQEIAKDHPDWMKTGADLPDSKK
jgi:hypothetical protein